MCTRTSARVGSSDAPRRDRHRQRLLQPDLVPGRPMVRMRDRGAARRLAIGARALLAARPVPRVHVRADESCVPCSAPDRRRRERLARSPRSGGAKLGEPLSSSSRDRMRSMRAVATMAALGFVLMQCRICRRALFMDEQRDGICRPCISEGVERFSKLLRLGRLTETGIHRRRVNLAAATEKAQILHAEAD